MFNLVINITLQYLESVVLDNNTWNHLTVCKQMSSGSFKNNVTNK